MNWTNKNVIQLIMAYKDKTVLWDPKHKNYYNRNLKQKAWEELAIETQRTVDELKKKMENLLSSLRRERAKIAKSSTRGNNEIYEPNWYAFKYLKFLMDRNKDRRRIKIEDEDRSSHEYTSDNEEEDPIGEDYDQTLDKRPLSSSTESDDQITCNNSNNPSQYALESSPSIMDIKMAPQDSMLKIKSLDLLQSSNSATKAAATASTQIPLTESDQFQLYANYLAAKFRSYSRQTYITLEHRINNLLYDADCGLFENQSGSHQASSSHSS